MKLIAPDSLDDAQRALLQGYSRFFPRGGVCVNLVIGAEPWDIRPLVLHQGGVTLFRFSMKLDEQRAQAIASDLDGHSAFFSEGQRAHLVVGEGRFYITRPFLTHTLSEALETGAIGGYENLLQVVRSLIQIIASLARMGIAHGHISPANIALQDGELVLLDPFFGALHRSRDTYLAPETSLGMRPDPSADLFSLGRIIKVLLGDSLSSRQSELVHQLLSPSPKERPALLEVAVAFGVQEFSSTPPVEPPISKGGAGRVVKAGSVKATLPSHKRIDSVPSTASVSTSNSTLTTAIISVGLLIATGMLLKYQAPRTYFRLARYLPVLAPERVPEYETEWATHERARMLNIARAAVDNREPAAINAIVDDILAGSNPDRVIAPLLRVALNESWRKELNTDDIHAALSLALAPLLQEGAQEIPPLAALHPGVVLAIAGQTNPTNAGSELRAIPLETIAKLPNPIGQTFSQLRKYGVESLGAPQAVALAAIISGNARATTFDAYISQASDPQRFAQLISLIEPIVGANPAAAAELLAAIRDRGGDSGTLVSWFDIDALADWASVPAIVKIRLILGTLPSIELSDPQYFDLLRFPLDPIKSQSIAKIAKRGFPAGHENLFATLISSTNHLNREQTIALLAALKLEPAKRPAFIAAWFEMKPPPETVLLILAARSNHDASDLFNLEAARYLRRNSWEASFDLLKLLAAHPEPLARVLVYGRLNPNVEAERSLLKERLSAEKDETCLKALMAKLSVQPPAQ